MLVRVLLLAPGLMRVRVLMRLVLVRVLVRMAVRVFMALLGAAAAEETLERVENAGHGNLPVENADAFYSSGLPAEA